MTIPTYRDVDLALELELVRAKGSVRPAQAVDRVVRHFPLLTAEDRAVTRPDGRTKVFDNIVHWGRNHLNVRGLLEKLTDGEWKTNAEAFAALADELVQRGVSYERAKSFIEGGDSIADLLGGSWAKALRLKGGSSGAEPPPTREKLSQARKPTVVLPTTSPLGDTLGASRQGMEVMLLARLNTIDPYEFEQLIGRLLDSIGFRDTQVVGKSGDEGVDIITYLHSAFVRAKIAVQVKRHSANVGPRDISYLRDRWSRRSDRLLFITTSDFTLGAKEVAGDEHDKQVALVNGAKLVDVMISQGLGVNVRPFVSYELDEGYLSGVDSSSGSVP